MVRRVRATAENRKYLEGRSAEDVQAVSRRYGRRLRGNPTTLTEAGERGAATNRATADVRAAELAPVIADLRARGRTTVRALIEGLTERKVPTERGGAWQPTQLRRILQRIATLPSEAEARS